MMDVDVTAVLRLLANTKENKKLLMLATRFIFYNYCTYESFAALV